MKQTAVEFTEELINIILYYLDEDELQRIQSVIDEAKEMEKQQIKDAWLIDGYYEPNDELGNAAFEEYYNETFKNK
jgi:hypothetical protein